MWKIRACLSVKLDIKLSKIGLQLPHRNSLDFSTIVNIIWLKAETWTSLNSATVLKPKSGTTLIMGGLAWWTQPLKIHHLAFNASWIWKEKKFSTILWTRKSTQMIPWCSLKVIRLIIKRDSWLHLAVLMKAVFSKDTTIMIPLFQRVVSFFLSHKVNQQ